MKILKTNKDITNYKLQKEQALQGCDICPCCGDKDKWRPFYDKGIRHIGDRLVTKGIFHTTVYTIDKFTCYTCGAAWESEPYVNLVV